MLLIQPSTDGWGMIHMSLDMYINKLDCLILQEAIAYLSLIMLIGAAVSSGITKKLVGKIGTKVTIFSFYGPYSY